MNGQGGGRDREEHRSKHRHHRHRHRREGEPAEADHRSYPDDRWVSMCSGTACKHITVNDHYYTTFQLTAFWSVHTKNCFCLTAGRQSEPAMIRSQIVCSLSKMSVRECHMSATIWQSAAVGCLVVASYGMLQKRQCMASVCCHHSTGPQYTCMWVHLQVCKASSRTAIPQTSSASSTASYVVCPQQPAWPDPLSWSFQQL